ncbi:type II secretion system protein [bacterium]|nr:MAG: type II secretion system protein [bacterium]
MRPSHRPRGITLVEILFVVAIVGLLVGTLTLVFAPKMRTKAMEARITGDLRQIMAATLIYQQENEGELPPSIYHYPKGTPIVVEGYPRVSEWSMGAQVKKANYFVTYNGVERRRERQNPGMLRRFDPQKNAFVKSKKFFNRIRGRHRYEIWSTPTASLFTEGPRVECLGGFLDGHVEWVPSLDAWEHYSMVLPLPYRNPK